MPQASSRSYSDMTAASKTKAKGGATIAWDANGAFVYSLEISFFAKATEKKWRNLATAINCQIEEPKTEDKASHWFATFAALSKTVTPGDLYLIGDVHPASGSSTTTAHWLLQWRRIPSKRPPK